LWRRWWKLMFFELTVFRRWAPATIVAPEITTEDPS